MAMTDDEFLSMCGFVDSDFRDPVHRADVLFKLAMRCPTIERLHEMANRLNRWTAGLEPKPEGVLVCGEHKRRQTKSRPAPSI